MIEETKQKPVGYGELKERKASGAHYTPIELADFVAKHIHAYLPKTSALKTVLDPAVGDGELLAAMARVETKNTQFRGYDIDLAAVEEAGLRIGVFSGINSKVEKKDFLNDIVTDSQASLFQTENPDSEKVDMVIANPPYIRTQVLGSAQSKLLAKKYNLTGRVDIYHAFIAKIAEVLKPGGIAGVIVSNRFMYTQGGKSIRELILREFEILHIWDFGDTKLFDAAVLPAVLILKKKNTDVEQGTTKFTSIYTNSEKQNDIPTTTDVFTALKTDGAVSINEAQFTVSTGILHIDDGQPWRISEQGRDDWLDKVKTNTYCYFEDMSKSKVGVKTTADKVFIQKDWGDSEPELTVPLITHHVAGRYKAGKPNRKILYPYDMNKDKKTPFDISKFPKTEKYLEQHREQLEGRKYVIEAGRKWYEIWVPHKPSEWKYPKIVFRDISERPTFWVDFDGDVVNGDCYWMSFKHKDEDYLWLTLAVANSSFIEKYYDYKFNNKLYSGRRRFITQYVSKFPLPDPKSDIAAAIIELSKKIYKANTNEIKEAQEVEVDALVWQAFDAN